MKTVLEGVLALILLASGGAKLARAKPVLANFTLLRIELGLLPVLGTVEVILAAGLILGFVVPIIGDLAALGVVVFMIGAVSVHLALKDVRTGPIPAVVIGLLAFILTMWNIPHIGHLFG